ncbi:cytochrome b5 [Colletotrichum truncatum]|uniref:Cytochrome b5 n=1 Tax=Colletotrichum truncatum TaxID=5467 RepID=A0ACC3YNL8_COLTU|nr:cytochrome b5 [Colletotrichum truncatum]KAF6789505.1 cytochrome b5 [Colletotrichum truncatum]
MHTYFLGLSLVGYDSLWGRMVRSGVAGAIGSVKRTGIFPNGDALRTSFTGLAGVDQYLIPAVIFYNNILSNGSANDRMLLISLFTTMQTMSHCMLVLGWNRGKRPWWATWEHLFWGVYNQAWGAAAVYPLYCFSHAEGFLRDNETETDEQRPIGPSDPTEALALIPTAILGSITPAMLLYPAFNPGCDTGLRQGIIAFYRFTPLALALAHPFFSSVQKKAQGSYQWKSPPIKSESLVATSLVISGAVATVGHGWALLGSISSGIRGVFWPSKQLNLVSPMMIADGARDFLQWDIIVITAALVPFADQVLKSSGLVRRLRKRNKLFSILSDSFIGRMALLTLASGILSPGAVVAFSLAVRSYT